MTAEIDLDTGREPAQIPVAVAPLRQEGRFGQVELCGQGLHPARITGGIQQTHRCRIAAERALREGVDHIELRGHGLPLPEGVVHDAL